MINLIEAKLKLSVIRNEFPRMNRKAIKTYCLCCHVLIVTTFMSPEVYFIYVSFLLFCVFKI